MGEPKFKYFDPIVLIIIVVASSLVYCVFQTWMAGVIVALILVIGHDWDYMCSLKNEATPEQLDKGKAEDN
jgi:hypothetical protein